MRMKTQNYQTPRINGKLLNQFMGRSVFLMVEDASPQQGSTDRYIARSPDGVPISLIVRPGESLER